MRLPVRFSGRLAFCILSRASPSGRPSSPSSRVADSPRRRPQITRMDTAAAPQTTEAAPQPFGYESEVACFGYIGPDDEQFIAQVVGGENSAEQTDFTEHNLLYLDAGVDRGLKRRATSSGSSRRATKSSIR